MLELAVLGLLKEQPLHGYELKKRLSDTLGSVWGVSYGSLYPALSRLEKAGAIEVVDPQLALARRADSRPMPPTGSLSGEAAAARRRRAPKPSLRTRKAYRITERGDALFGELLAADETSGSDEERSFALKLAFCRYLPTEGRIELLQRRRARLADRLARNRRALAPREQTPAPVPDLYTRSLLEHRTESTIRELVWVDNLIAAERQSPPEGATA